MNPICGRMKDADRIALVDRPAAAGPGARKATACSSRPTKSKLIKGKPTTDVLKLPFMLSEILFPLTEQKQIAFTLKRREASRAAALIVLLGSKMRRK